MVSAETGAQTGSGGLVNLRDVGGLPLVGGGATRAGVLFRSDALLVGDPTPPSFPHWPPSTVIDLRSDAEVALAPSGWPRHTVVVRNDLSSAARLDGAAQDDPAVVYRLILDRVPERVARVVEHLHPTGPTLVHCTAGKDRTGIVVAALLLLAGASPEAVVADYRLTEQAMPRVLDRMRASGVLPELTEVPVAWTTAPEAAVRVVVDVLEGWPGGPEGWFLDSGGSAAALAVWRERIRGL